MGLTSVLGTIGSIASSYAKKPLTAFSQLETSEGGHTIVAKDGSLATVLRIDGVRQILGDEELEHLIERLTVQLSPYFGRPGHALQVWFSRDPDLSGLVVQNLMRPPRNVAAELGLDFEDVFDAKESHLPNYIVAEGFYFVLWTRLSILTKQELQRAKIDRKPPKGWPTFAEAQDINRSVRALVTRHQSFVDSLLTDLGDVGIRAEALDADFAIEAVRSSIYPDLTDSGWLPSLPGGPAPRRRPELSPTDASHYLWPRLDDQIFDREAERVNPRVVRVGAYNFAGVDMTIGPQEVQNFSYLLGRMIDGNVSKEMPWRFSALVEGEGLSMLGIQSFLAAIFTITNRDNRAIREAIQELKTMRSEEGLVVCRLRISFATWAPADDLRLIEDRASKLKRAVEGWGYCEASQLSGDPLACVMSSALALDIASTAPAGVPPLHDVIRMLPWNRDASPWPFGSVLFRTGDGRPWAYQPGTEKQDAFIDLVFAPPGKGKSVWLNTTGLATCLSPAATTGTGGQMLPRVAIIDIGVSSSGLISLLKEALPIDRRHEVAYHRLRMTKDYAINPFDTQLGCRYPLPNEKAFLVNFLSLLGTPVGSGSSPEGLADIAARVVDEVYARFDDKKIANSAPKQYVHGEDFEVDEALRSRGIIVPASGLTWWDVVDALFERGAEREAILAQRRAVPLLEDLQLVLRDDRIVNNFGTAMIGTGEKVIDVFARMITAVSAAYPLLTVPTRFDIGAARVVSLDLDEVAPSVGDFAAKSTAMSYMLARYATARDFYLNEDIVNLIPDLYREHHRTRIRRIRETPKRLVYDEFHRTSVAPQVREQVMIDMREGRKWGVHIVLASQLLDDFPPEMINVATGIWIMGVANAGNAREVAERFDLSRTAESILKHHLNGPGPGGAPFLVKIQLRDGQHEHMLVNTLSPVEAWAFSTTAEDTELRRRLYAILGPKEARRRLAARFRTGSAKNEIARRLKDAFEQGRIGDEVKNGIIDRIVLELSPEAAASRGMPQPEPPRRTSREAARAS
ncbi:hypothetical protein [Methylorubrum extorquens]|jgi:intracellular multiplication protein IcmB|uniref:Type IV secretion protein IcmB n=1 Tax=Methylorubrum extorquens (strain ATCC 14718 / DSM 1338 / JCM 2805 / NCIMB 9133 / AM1) TaxID=272630 RepID=C5B4H4_METEA|nr:hypothetical protein [Methylorubrum extorquens]ACS43356.1 Conserved hypothetical protein [Methylorubrum extorquens AM1]MCP1545549.1 intracellular multiplication protein IcmB [Methylorubrum extorquens]MCP1591500.1 intracellular multiplication protein IcmB [Methylorubrum extorquens]